MTKPKNKNPTKPEILLVQDPHNVGEAGRRKSLEVSIGRDVRALRKQKGITVTQLANVTGLSIAMLSKIENGNTSASLTTLQRLADALGIQLSSLFRRFEEDRAAVYTKAGAGVDVERASTRSGKHYTLLGHLGSTASGVTVEPYLITLKTPSDVFPVFQHSGVETLYMLEGKISYRHSASIYSLEPGDTLFFDADAPHGPEELIELPARYLSIISYRHGT